MLTIAAILSAAFAVDAPAAAGEFATGHVLAKYAPGALATKGAAGRLARALAIVQAGAPEAPTPRPAMNLTAAAAIGLDRWVRIPIPETANPVQAALALQAAWDGFEVVEADPIGSLADITPNDPLFSLQYALQNTGQLAGTVDADIDATGAWPIASENPELIIGFLDGGVYGTHPEIAGRILPGWNVPQNNSNTTDICGSHGTHVTGIAMATGNNAVGIAGVCWNAKSLPVVIVNPCTGQESWLADGITWAVDQGADVLNLSVQYSIGTQYLHDAVIYAALHGVPMVAATGNSAAGVAYPAKWVETIAVGATTQNDTRWTSSNFGPEIDLCAPGSQVYSLSGTSTYAYKSGTSMAVPHVVGVIALMRAVSPQIPADAIRAILQATAHDIDTAGFDQYTGWGRLDAATAVAAADAYTLPADLDGDGAVSGGDLAMLLSAFGTCGDCSDCAADLDSDCAVGGSDLSLLLASWSP